ncbi:MAG: hypothetical protein AAB433_17455 [Nitrospirota bacterium]
MGPVRPLSESMPPRCHHGAEEPNFCDAELIAGQTARKAELSRRLASETVFYDIRNTLGTGFVPDLFEGMHEKPAYLETAWELFKEDLQLEQLDHKTKQMIALAISTDGTGNYCITEYPHAFRLNALDETICDKIVLTIRFFRAFDRYLSGVRPRSLPDTPSFLRDCLRDEFRGFEEALSSAHGTPEQHDRPRRVWIGNALILMLLLPIAATVYLILI